MTLREIDNRLQRLDRKYAPWVLLVSLALAATGTVVAIALGHWGEAASALVSLTLFALLYCRVAPRVRR